MSIIIKRRDVVAEECFRYVDGHRLGKTSPYYCSQVSGIALGLTWQPAQVCQPGFPLVDEDVELLEDYRTHPIPTPLTNYPAHRLKGRALLPHVPVPAAAQDPGPPWALSEIYPKFERAVAGSGFSRDAAGRKVVRASRTSRPRRAARSGAVACARRRTRATRRAGAAQYR